MTEFVIDLSNYRDRMGANVPEGRYTVVVDDAEMDKSKAGNPMINMWLRIVDGDQKDLVLTDRLTLTERSMFRIVGFMQAINLPTPRKRLKLNLKTFLGKTLQVDVADGEPYNGRVKSEVKGYLRVAAEFSTAEVSEELPEAEPVESAAETAEPEPEKVTAAAEPEAADEPMEVDLDEIDLG